MKFNDVLLGLMVLAGGVAIYLSSLGFTPIPGQAYGAETMPRALSLLCVCLGLFITIRGVAAAGWRPSSWRPGVAFADWAHSPASLLALAITILAIVAYIVLSPPLGFVPVAFAVLFVLMLTLRTPPLTALLVSALAVVVVQQAFGRILLVPLPRNAWLSFLW